MKNNYVLNNKLSFGLLLMLMIHAGMNQLFAQCGSASLYKPTVSNSIICSGNQVNIYATGLPVSSWIYRDNNLGSWLVFSSGSDNAAQFVSTSVTTIRTYKAVVITASCPTDTTLGVDVTITPASYGVNNAIKLSSSTLQVCSGNQITLRMMNQGVQTVSWLYRDNGGVWTLYANTTSQALTITMPNTLIPINREYRVLTKTNSCQQDSSDVLAVSILPLVAGVNPNIRPISTQNTICGGTTVSLQVDWGGTIGDWIYKDANSTTWQVFTSGSASVNDFSTNVTASTIREYKVILKNTTNCGADSSASYFVTINASQKRTLLSILPRITGTSTQVCAGNSMSFQLSGYSNIQSWLYRDSATGTWTTFGSSSSSPSVSSSSSITKDVVREVKVVVNNSALTCTYDTSASVFYTIKANVRGNTLSAIPFSNVNEICVGAQATLYMQNGQNVTGWIYRNNNIGNWTSSGSSGTTYTDYNTSNFLVNTLRSYKAIINNAATCRIDTTPEVQIMYKPAVVGGVIAITPIVSQPSYCAGSSVSGNVNFTSSALQAVKWVYRDNNIGIWNDLAFQTSQSFSDNNTQVTSATKRYYRLLIRNLETYKIDTSLSVSVDLNVLSRGSVGLNPVSTSSTICNDNSVALSIVPTAAYTVYNWLYRDSSNQVWSTYNTTSTSISLYVSTTFAQRTFRVVLLNNAICKYDTTNALVMPVLKKVNRNNGSYLPVITSNSICGGATFSLSVSLNNGTSVLRWIYRDNNSAWKEISNSSTSYFESSNNTKVLVPTLREYKVLVNDNNNCVIDTSAGVTVNINPYSNGATSSVTPTSSFTTYCSGINLPVSINYNGSVQKWVFRDNGGKWNEFAFNTASTSLNDQNAFVSTSTNREYRAFLIRSNTCIIDTTQPFSIQLKPYLYGNANAIQPTASAANICSGTSMSVTINSGTGYSVHKWIYKENNLGEWRDIVNSSASSSYFESNTSVTQNTLKTYRAIIQTNTCSYDTTAQVSVQMNARTYGYASAVTVTSASGVYCSAATINVNVISTTMPSGASVARWVYKDNTTGIWYAIPSSQTSSLAHTFTSVAVPTIRSYRAVINNTTTCSYDSSSIFSVTINPSGSGYAGTITPIISLSSVCNANTNPTLSVSLPSGYSILKWVVNNNATGWMDFGYATNNTFITDYNTAVQSPVSRNYRAILSNSTTCSIDSTNTVGATINPTIRGNIVATIPTATRINYCYSKSVSVSVVVPSGYTVEKWIYADNGAAWSDFTSSTTSSTLTDNNTYVSTTTGRAYRVILANNTTCQKDTTSATTIVINARGSNIGLRSIVPTSNPVAGICSASSVTLNVNPGTGNEIYRWTYSDNGTQWNDILNSYNATSITHQLTQTNVALTRQYRAIITDTSSCDFDSTQTVTVNITPITYGNDTSIVINGLDTSCIGSTVSLTVNVGSNSINKWLYSDNNGAWKNFTNNTQSTSLNDANTLVASGSTRGYTALVYKTSVCRIDTLTKVKVVYFKNKTYGNSTTTVSISADTVCANNTVSVSTSGTVERWLYRDGTVGTWTSIANASTFLSHTATNVSVSGWRFYRALYSIIGSCTADSSAVDSVFLKIQGNGNVLVAPTVTSNIVCAGNGVNLSLSISGATMQRWIYRDNGIGNWNIFSTSTSFSITDYNTGVAAPISREYRAIVFRNCSYDTTNAVVVTITPKTRGVDLTKTPTTTTTNVCAASAVQNLQIIAGTGNVIYQWLYSDNNGPWQVLSNGNQNNLTDYNTLVGAAVIRKYVAIIDNNTTCRFDTTAALSVNINPVVLGNSTRLITLSSTACMGSNYNLFINVGTDTTIIRFLNSTNGGPWVDRGYISPSTTQSISDYAYNGAPYTIAYRAILYKASNCHIDTSASTVVSVNPRTYGNDNSILPTATASVCSGVNFNVAVSPGSNTVSRWLYSDDGINWTVYYSSATTISQQVNTALSITRKYRALIVKSSSCSIDTSAAVSITINPIVYATDNISQVTIGSSKPGCTGAVVNVSASPGSNSINTWLYRDNGNNWNNMYLASTSITDYNTNTTSSVTRIYGVVIWKLATCHMDTTTKNDTINISPRTNGNDPAITISPSSSSICIGSSVTLTAAVGSHSIEKWYYKDNGGAWNILSSSTSASIVDYNTSVSATTTRVYRALIRKSNICAFDTSASTTVTISPRGVGSDATLIPTVTNANVCSGSAVVVSLTPGISNTIQKWIMSQNGGAWTDYAITSATSISDYNTVVSVSTQRRYRAIVVKGSGCTLDTSALVLVTINPIGFGNQNTVVPTANKSAICSGSSVNISVTGFSGTAVLRWLYRDNTSDPWTPVYSSSTVLADFSTITSTSINRQYRAVVNNNSGCSTDTTAAVTVAISPILNGTISTPVLSSQSTVCSGNPINLFVSPPAGRTVTSWLSKEASGTWNLLFTSQSASVNDFNTSVTANTVREYKAILSNAAGCSLDSSTSVSVNINILTQGTNLSITPNTTTPTICSGSTAIVGVSGFSGTVTNWIYRDSVVNGWSTIGNVNFTLFHTNTFVSYPRVRQYCAIVYNANNCSNDTTAAVQVMINPQLAGNANSISPTAGGTTSCSGAPISLNASGFINGGSVTGWLYSDNGGVWTRIPGALGASYTDNNTSVTSITSRQYRALVLTGCNTDTTAALAITIDVYPTKPVITEVVGSDSLICSETATSYEWRLNGNIIPGAINKAYVSTTSGTYTVSIGNANGCKTLSDGFVHFQVGIENVFASAQLSIYPNPTLSGMIMIDWNGLPVSKSKLLVMDLLGRTVLEKEVAVAGSSGTAIDLTPFNGGVYFIKLTAEGSSITHKVIYQK